jgi:hypothetical protein
MDPKKLPGLQMPRRRWPGFVRASMNNRLQAAAGSRGNPQGPLEDAGGRRRACRPWPKGQDAKGFREGQGQRPGRAFDGLGTVRRLPQRPPFKISSGSVQGTAPGCSFKILSARKKNVCGRARPFPIGPFPCVLRRLIGMSRHGGSSL